MKQSERIRFFTEEIWGWYENHKRELPWRDLRVGDTNERAYQILVSEVMLQQTQVERVKIVFKNFLQLFPKMKDLAKASNREVILAWRGMGYNSRALRLRDAAKEIQDIYKGEFPSTMEELTSLKGIGHYTAGAIRNFAFNLPTPCLDTNIRRILHRVFVGPEHTDGTWEKDDGYLLELAGDVLEVALNQKVKSHRSKVTGQLSNDLRLLTFDTANWHAALMDYGSLVCTKRNPKWEICPLTQKGIMKTTPKNYELRIKKYEKLINHNSKFLILNSKKKEPGRTIGSRFIPNRIFRGKIIEELRDEPRGLPITEIGKRVCLDWSKKEHEDWLRSLLSKLTTDQLLRQQGARYLLAE